MKETNKFLLISFLLSMCVFSCKIGRILKFENCNLTDFYEKGSVFNENPNFKDNYLYLHIYNNSNNVPELVIHILSKGMDFPDLMIQNIQIYDSEGILVYSTDSEITIAADEYNIPKNGFNQKGYNYELTNSLIDFSSLEINKINYFDINLIINGVYIKQRLMKNEKKYFVTKT